MLTVAYSLRFAWGALGFARRTGTRGRPGCGPAARAGVRGSRRPCSPGLTLVFGLVPAAVDGLVGGRGPGASTRRSSRSTSRSGTASACPLALSVVVLAGGLGLFLGRPPPSPGCWRWASACRAAAEVYLAILRGVNVGVRPA